MKRGTNVGLDKNFNNVCVGDNIIDKDGSEYVINAYGLAVDLRKGGTKKLSEVKDFEVKKAAPGPDNMRGGAIADEPKDAAAQEQTQQPKPEAASKPSLEPFSDKELADELRRRGYTLTATKTIEL